MLRALLLSLVLLVAVATPASADLAAVRSRGKLIVATSGSFPPFTGATPSGGVEGFDIAYLEAIAAKLGVKAEFVTLEGSGIFAGLLAKKFDTACAGYVITEERLKAVDFPEPYAFGGTVMLVRAGDDSFNNYQDLRDKRIGVILGSVDERRMRTIVSGWKELKTYPGWSEEWADLMAGRVDGLSTQYAVAKFSMARERDGAKAKIAGDPVFRSVLGFPLRKEDAALRQAMTEAIRALKAEGFVQQASQRWLRLEIAPAQIDAVWQEQDYLGR